MRDDDARIRFSATVGRGGTILVPAELRPRFRPGQAVRVTIVPVPRRAGRPGFEPDEDEVAWIAALQAEPPAIIRKCLLAQGAFAAAQFRTRAAPGRKSRGAKGRRAGAR